MDLGKPDSTELVEVHRSEKTCLCGIGLAPTLAVTFGLFFAESAWTAILLLHLSMLVFPLVFTRDFDFPSLRSLLQGEAQNFSQQVRIGASLLGLTVATMVVSLTAFLSVPGINLPQLLGFQKVSCDYFLFDCDNVEFIAAFAVYFSIVNPGVEEAFWRLFLYRSLPKTEGWKWGVSLMYAAYHVVVVLKFSGFWQAVLCIVSLTLMGRIFVLVRESSGLLAGALLHCGLDLSLIGAWLYLLFWQ